MSREHARDAHLGAIPLPAPFHAWAPTPPMGWNSWDCFATTVTEAMVKAQADYMAQHLARHGWQYIVVDIQWYEPNATGFAYREDAEVAIDAWGRLLPAGNRFPSCALGFRPLSDYVHALGLKFGVHLLRGIPRRAVALNLPILGRPERAADIARLDSTCTWNPDMYGVDMSKPGAQAYYDSVFAEFAAWGVDYVKVDDISRPYHDNEAEIEAIRAAIDRTGRPMLLSLSPGATALSAAAHVQRHANLWRISDDFWDNWDVLFEQFERLRQWNPHRGAGYWPDADMLPLGVLDLGRRHSRFTRDEQRTVMTLWAIARSPLMHGGDMTKMDEFTLSLLNNPEVLAVNQHSRDNQPLFDKSGLIAWTALPATGDDVYLAVFNTRDRQPLEAERAVFQGELLGGVSAYHTLHVEAELTPGAALVLVVDDGRGGNGEPHAVVWGEPVLEGIGGGVLALTEHPWAHATSRWGNVQKDQTAGGRPLTLGGRPLDRGLLVHSKSVIEFDVPPGYSRFVAECGFESSTRPLDDRARSRCLVFSHTPDARLPERGLTIEVSAAELGFAGQLSVRDLWSGADLGTFEGSFSPSIAWHGSGLFRVSGARK